MQPYFFPYIGYFQAIHAVDKYILYENITYIKDAWMNRNRILQKNGSPFFLTIPIRHKSSNKLIKEIAIDNTRDWRKRLLQSIYLNYKGSMFFEEIYSLLEFAINNPFENLYQYNASVILCIARFLNIDTEIVFKNNNYLDIESRLEAVNQKNYNGLSFLELTHPEKKVARVIAICKNEKADCFINAIGGISLYSKTEFIKYGIDLKFVNSKQITYNQFSHEFFPNLSIIDVLMHNGKEKTKEILCEYELI